MVLRCLLLFLFAVNVIGESDLLTPLANASGMNFTNGKYHVWNYNRLSISSDLKTWTTYTPPFSSFNFAFGNNRYVFSSNGQVHVSSDLIDFQRSPVSGLGNLIFDGTRFLSATSIGIYSSTDGLSWQQLLEGRFNSITTAGGRTVAVGERIARSVGEGFTLVENAPEGLSFVAALPGLVVANNSQGQVTVSTDGLEWSHLGLRGQEIRGRIFAARGKFYNDTYGLVSSSNGLDWTPIRYVTNFSNVFDDGTNTLVLADELQSLGQDGTLSFVAFGRASGSVYSIAGNLIMRRNSGFFVSNNARDWIKTAENFSDLRKLISDEALIFSTNDGLIVTKDGITWQRYGEFFRPNIILQTPLGFLAGNAEYLGCSFYLSSDGLDWTPIEVPCFVEWMASNSEIMVSVFEGQVWRSTNLIDWEATGHYSDLNATSLNFGENFIFPGINGKASLTRDGHRFQRIAMDGSIRIANGLWNMRNSVWHYSLDGRSWAPASFPGQPEVVWQDRIVSSYLSDLYVSDLPQAFKRQAIVPWVVENEKWQSRIVLNNSGDAMTRVDLKAVGSWDPPDSLTLELAPGEVYTREIKDLFPGRTRYSLYVDAFAPGVYTVFQVNALVNDVYSPSQSSGIFLDATTTKLAFPLMAADDANALVLVETGKNKNSALRLNLGLYDELGQELATREIFLSAQSPYAIQVVDLFPDLVLPPHFSIKVTGGTRLAGTAFIFNQEGQPSMANAFPLFN